MSVEIQTFIGSPEHGFREVSEVPAYEGDEDYVPGAISLVADGTPIITLREWDDVNWLWPFVVRASAEFRERGEGETYFPDQPLVFRLEQAPEPGCVALSLRVRDVVRRHAVVDSGEYFRSLAAAGLHYFDHQERLIPGSGLAAMREVAALRSWLE